MRDDRQKILDILEAIEKIDERTKGNKGLFYHDEVIQVWVLYHIQIIGEAAGRISESLRNKYTNIPWPDIIALRNVIVHHYFGIDLDQIWETITNDLPTLKTWVTQMLNDIQAI